MEDLDLILPTICMMLWIPLCLLVARAAGTYRRSPVGWFVLACIFSPLIAYVFLLVADVPHKAMLRQELEDRVKARRPESTDTRVETEHEMDCTKCGAAVNSYTGDGLHSPDDEPWRLMCDKCEKEIVL